MLERYVFDKYEMLVYDIEHPYRAPMPYESFKKAYASCTEDALTPAGRPTTISRAEAWLKHDHRMTCFSQCFVPGGERFIDGKFNTWDCPWIIGRGKSFKKQFDALFAQVFPIPEEREYALQWFAHIIQHPDNPPPIALISVTKQTGTGRGILIEVISSILGTYHTSAQSLESLIESTFNDWRHESLLTVIHEAHQPTFRDRLKYANLLKTVISDSTVRINPKGRKPFNTKTYNRLFMSTNSADGILIEEGDRRVAVVEGNKNKMPRAQSDELAELIKNPAFRKYVATRLLKIEIKINFFEEPPMTESRKLMMDLSVSDDVQTMMEQLVLHPKDFDHIDTLAITYLGTDHARRRGVLMRALREIGAIPKQFMIPNPVTKADENRRYWVLRNHDFWVKFAAKLQRAKHLESGERPSSMKVVLISSPTAKKKSN